MTLFRRQNPFLDKFVQKRIGGLRLRWVVEAGGSQYTKTADQQLTKLLSLHGSLSVAPLFQAAFSSSDQPGRAYRDVKLRPAWWRSYGENVTIV
jgi:hypothetical protein